MNPRLRLKLNRNDVTGYLGLTTAWILRLVFAVFMASKRLSNLLNVDRDWNKVARYARHLQVIDETVDSNQCGKNHSLREVPHSGLQLIACYLEK